MGSREAHDPQHEDPDLPQFDVVEVTVLRNPGARRFPRPVAGNRGARRAAALLAVASVLAIAAAATLWPGDQDAKRPLPNSPARQPGPDGVAAAYGYPPACLSVTILATDRVYARADFNHLSDCGRYTGYPTAIFHYVSGTWRPVLDAIGYRCPVDSLPTAVQTELDVCVGNLNR